MVIRVNEEVKRALEQNWGIVALESTIITHGMPAPQNWETALALEETVREEGAIPATIGILEGEIIVGLQQEEIKELASRQGVKKISRQDLAFAVSQGWSGGTTVAATMIVARRAGIEIFATGGIGGVHRGGENTLDISADLEELARTGVVVFCAGVKSILDIGRTLEYLETRGIPVIGYRTDEFPAFYCPRSGFPAPLRLDSPEEIGDFWKKEKELQLGGGAVVACPIPEKEGIKAEEMEQALNQALQEAQEEGITGKGVTPFLLQRVNEYSQGQTLQANQFLIKNNAAIAARVSRVLQSGGE